jgi:hypothetical protein
MENQSNDISKSYNGTLEKQNVSSNGTQNKDWWSLIINTGHPASAFFIDRSDG